MFDHTALEPLLDRVTSMVHGNYPEHHDEDDTKSALWIWVYENQKTIEKIARSADNLEGPLFQMLTNAATSFLKKEDAVTYGYQPEDAFLYPLKAVRELLDNAFDYRDWQPSGDTSDGQPRAKAQVNHGGTYVAMLCDVKIAFGKLNKNQKEVILYFYKDRFDDEMIADLIGLGLKGAKSRRDRAERAIQKSLGTKPLSDLRRGFTGRSGPSGRAAEQATVERDYEG